MRVREQNFVPGAKSDCLITARWRADSRPKERTARRRNALLTEGLTRVPLYQECRDAILAVAHHGSGEKDTRLQREKRPDYYIRGHHGRSENGSGVVVAGGQLRGATWMISRMDGLLPIQRQQRYDDMRVPNYSPLR